MKKESLITEWKQTWKDDYLKWICGFANAEGGSLLIGYDDKGTLVGINNASKLLEDIPNKCRDIMGIIPSVNLIQENGLDALEIMVEPSSYPVNYKGQYHFRSGSTKQEMKGRALDDFILRKQGKHWDGLPVVNLKLDDLDASAIQEFKQKALKGMRLDRETLEEDDASLFEKLHLFEEKKLKRAAALLFHHDPEKYITGAYVKIGFFRSETDLLYQDEIHGPLITQIDKTLDMLTTKYLRAMISYEGIQRVEKYPFPVPALREAVTNAIAHKNYSGATPIQIKVFEDKIQIWNDAILPDNWTIDVLKKAHPSKPYNPDIANTMFRAGMVEAWGRGTIDILNYCSDYGLVEPEFRFDITGFSVIFIGNVSEKNAGETLVKNAGKTPVRIVDMIKQNPEITLVQIAQAIDKSPSAVERAAAKLVKEGVIRYVGPKRGGHWEIMQESDKS